MLKKIYNIFRPDASAEFWHLIPENREWAESVEKEMIENGLMISCENTISDDGLLFTRTTLFQNLDGFHRMKEALKHLSYDQDRIDYNTANSHIFFSSDEEIE
jgi:hypothetical protein